MHSIAIKTDPRPPSRFASALRRLTLRGLHIVRTPPLCHVLHATGTCDSLRRKRRWVTLEPPNQTSTPKKKSLESENKRGKKVAMVAISKLLNFALPPLSLLLLTILMLPSLIFKLLMQVRKSLRKENVANKVALITGAASGIGEVCYFFYPC
ncbi:hypothetical protein V8G54_002831 [Vigna mungo]|uniref:Uncharacterized protein n=1 Tax=Vigna mungo TaxID=3915 RepID=A0AAQ3SB68_VIGMU